MKARYTDWSCPVGPAELVDWLVDRGDETTYDKFVKEVDIEGLPTWWEGMPDDWGATYLFTELPSGQKAWVVQHGGIEFLFTQGARFDERKEGKLAVAFADWLADHNDYNWVSDLPDRLVKDLRKQFLAASTRRRLAALRIAKRFLARMNVNLFRQRGPRSSDARIVEGVARNFGLSRYEAREFAMVWSTVPDMDALLRELSETETFGIWNKRNLRNLISQASSELFGSLASLKRVERFRGKVIDRPYGLGV